VPFANRAEAGQRLGERLREVQDAVVLGLPRGGVVVAFEVAKALGAALDVILVRKLGVPYQPELGMGAIGEDGVRVLNARVLSLAGVGPDALEVVEERERAELERRAHRYRGDRLRVPVDGRTAIVVDDGIATGSTARAACQVARAHGAARVVLAVPVGPPSTITELAGDADEVICLETPEWFAAIGQWYRDFSQTSDEEVVELLARARASVVEEEVEVCAGDVRLPGHLHVPAGAAGVVVFAHGSGSSRHSPRNRFVADALAAAGLGTLLFDLLTPEEEGDRANVFDVELLARRLLDATAWLRELGERRPGLRPVERIGYFGASTGAGAALWAAAEPGADVAAVVSRGGRPDLAGSRLADVRAPTLLIVGGRDDAVLELNRQARARLVCESELAVVPGATHLFEEPGALEQVADLARDWFLGHLSPPS